MAPTTTLIESLQQLWRSYGRVCKIAQLAWAYIESAIPA